jgi:polysaccharide export outer membrane protein
MFFARPVILMSLAAIATVVASSPARALPLSPGDRVRVFIVGDEDLPAGDRFGGVYEVNLDGTIQVPFLEPLNASGLELSQVEQQLSQRLINQGIFRPDFLQLSVKIVQWAPIQVTVSGATFEPGRVLINPNPEEGSRDQPEGLVAVSGDYPPERYLTAALRNAGGVKPNADIQNIRLIRGEQERTIDLSGVVTGGPVQDVPLIAGDLVVVPQLESIQNNELVRPSQVTPQTIPIFFSNLTTPSPGGGTQAQELEYGTRFSNAVVAAQCVGGTRSTNANRRAVLVQTDRLTGETQTINRSVEDLVKQPGDDSTNPYLMPNDGLVCYDSSVTNASSLFRIIGDFLNPISIIRNLFFNGND